MIELAFVFVGEGVEEGGFSVMLLGFSLIFSAAAA